MTVPADSSTMNALVAEIAQRFSEVGVGRIVACLERARHDLEGSVKPEALPEMAARLAIFRLESFSLATVA
jgi:hypothetical protein